MPCPSSSQGWTSGLQPAATGELSEIPIADLLDDDSDILIVEPGSGGISHIKAPSSFELSLAQHASAKPGAMSESAVVDALQSQLDRLEPGALVDKSTPKDGHCLFHALAAAGLLQDRACGVDIGDLTRIALETDPKEQSQIAATSIGISVSSYVERMRDGDYGDNLVIVLLSVCFDKPIAVISLDAVRVYWPGGREQRSADPAALLVAHRPDQHYPVVATI